MAIHPHDTTTDDTQADAGPLRLERVMTRRRMLLMSGAALMPLLAACGDEDEAEDVPEQVDPPEEPDIDPDEPGMDAPDTGLESPEADAGT